MKKIIYIFGILFCALFSCTEKELLPVSNSLGKPDVVTDVVVQPLPGGAKLTYKIPNTEDLLAVKCIYHVTSGQEHEVSASFYENQILIQGFNDTLEHKATLYAVNRGQELSDPVSVIFKPLESPLSRAVKSVEIEADFGGARFSWDNEFKVPLNVEFLGPDSTGEMSTLNIMTSDIDNNVYNIRGYKSEPQKFSMIISDNYGNYSDTLSSVITPLFEEELDKKNMCIMRLKQDAAFAFWGTLDAYMIDDNLSTFGHTANNVVPATFTVDLGCTAKLSRFTLHQRAMLDDGVTCTYYTQGNAKTIEVYTCDHLPSDDGDWSEWTKIMDCEVEKPSGSPGLTVTDLDIEAARKGHDFSFDIDQPPMRYLRMKITTTWSGASYTAVAELDFYGQKVNE